MTNRYNDFEFFDKSGRCLPDLINQALNQELGCLYPESYFFKEKEAGKTYFLDVVYHLYEKIADTVRWHLHWEGGEVRSFAVGDLVRYGEFFSAVGDIILEIGYQAGGFKEFLPPRFEKNVSGFEPIVSPNSKILILGTMPGINSLRLNQYYADGRNQFWKILDHFNHGYYEAKYFNKLQKLNTDGIALWDVLSSAERDGSLDANIDGNTIIINDFQSFFKKYKNIKAVFFNGKKANELFQQYVAPHMPPDLMQSLKFVRLPSTSSANRRQTLQEKIENWDAVFSF